MATGATTAGMMTPRETGGMILEAVSSTYVTSPTTSIMFPIVTCGYGMKMLVLDWDSLCCFPVMLQGRMDSIVT